MDKGAHFYCCDFQVHTPRDRNWEGKSAVLEADRLDYGREFVSAARVRGLNAVAITDHHDMAFIPYIRKAAREETDSSGALLPKEQQLIVFPGMELTLGVPCQALLLFDADFPNDMFALALTALAITTTPPEDQFCHEVQRLDDIKSFEQLCELLDRHAYLRNRYIAIPNVSEGGKSTMLRSGYAGHYKNMPCVAGYLDGKVGQLGKGNSQILAGLDANYGNKPLGLFQTSDNRRRDFKDLADSVTWVKWAEPTTEALRQACLARESRIFQGKPLLPSVVVSAINVSNSAFLGPLYLEFNSQYNAIIGGRGTGKSTVLEYLRWALCDEPLADDEDAPAYQKRRDKLLAQTLTGLKANIQVDFSVHGVPHSVRRNAATNELTLKIGSGSFEPSKAENVRNLLPIQAYSQKQLSGVGVRMDELNRFVLGNIRGEIKELESLLKTISGEIRKQYTAVQQFRRLHAEIGNEEKQLFSLTEQATAARGDLAGVGESERAILSKKAQYDQEEEILNSWKSELDAALDAVETFKGAIAARPTRIAGAAPLPHVEFMQEAEGLMLSVFAELRRLTSSQEAELKTADSETSALSETRQKILDLHTVFANSYEAAKATSTAHESKLKEFARLEQQLKSVRTRLSTKKAEALALGDPSKIFSELRSKWKELHQNRSALVEAQCGKLTSLSEGQIKATLKRAASLAAVEEKLRAILSGTNIRGNKIDSLLAAVSSDVDPLQRWEIAIEELESLFLAASTAPESGITLPSTPHLMAAGFTVTDLEKIARKLTPELWIDLTVTSLNDSPVFDYKVRDGEFIAFGDASAGQQATALLWVLLKQPGPPLIIDQPEDDLDNQVMLKTVEKLWHAKQYRQIIFSSHNANLVVNGDADLVMCCDYRVTGEQSGGTVKLQGAIDVAAIRHEIASVMEGGREAFRLRKDKYGF